MTTHFAIGRAGFVGFVLLAVAGCGAEQGSREDGPLSTDRIVDGDPWAGDVAAGFLGCGKTGGAFCTGTLIGASTVVTAAHCVTVDWCTDIAFFTEDDGVATYHAVERIHANPGWNGKDAWDSDIAVMQLVEPAVGVTPVVMPAGAPAKADRIDLVGYGLTSEGGTGAGTKRITESSIRDVLDRRIVVEGTEDDDGGICNGDSGGPALTWSDAKRRIVGVHSYKQGDCGTVSGHVRVDAYADWIASKADGDLGCGAIDYRGACFGTTLAWCSGGDTLTYMQCADYANTPTCGWLNDEIGYSCLLADPGEDTEPEPPQQQQPPAESSAQCDALGYVGACYGETSMWTENGDCRVRDCVAEGRSCGWIDDNTGWGCLGGQEGATTFSCGALDYAGQCMADDTLVWVENGACRVEHCPSTGRVCGWDDRPLADGSGPIGNNCLSG